MNNIIAERKAPTGESPRLAESLFEICHHFDLTTIPLKPKSKVPLVRWSDENWKPSPMELEAWGSKPGVNWGVRCGQNLAVIDCDTEKAYQDLISTNNLPLTCPVVKTGRGYHIWVKPTKPIRSQRTRSVEIKCLGSYIVAPPSIHPSGVPYVFQVPPNGVLPEVDLDELFNLPSDNTWVSSKNLTNINAPSDCGLRYGKSPYPQTLCGRATKTLISPDGRFKKLISLQCWKWHCPKCALLLKHHWLDKLNTLSFRFILMLPTAAKPTAFLRRTGKPSYIHIVDNGSSWLFLMQGEAEKVWSEVRNAGYRLVVGDTTGAPTPQELLDCLDQALCREREPLNTRRKISHSRGFVRKAPLEKNDNESKRTADRIGEDDHMKKDEDNRPHTWKTVVIMKPIEQVAKQLEVEGWHLLWKSEVEALAFRSGVPNTKDTDIVELLDMLGVKLKRIGKEYVGLCPFHDDHDPSLSVNKEKNLWHCFGCGRSGNAEKFLVEWQQL